MSLDLYFYRRQNDRPTREDIERYLAGKIGLGNQSHEWFFENKETGVYYSFSFSEDKIAVENKETSFNGFEDTGFAFNLNYGRPDFFGLEAFQFVDQFLEDLDLFVINPQLGDESDLPHKPQKKSLYSGWSDFNARISAEYFGQVDGASYFPKDKSNYFWQYNFNRKMYNDELGDEYFVPIVFFLRKIKDNSVHTLATWTESIPNVFPPTDYYCLVRSRKKLFKTVKEMGFISRKKFLDAFGEFLADFEHPNCKIIHSQQASKATSLFNKIEFDSVKKEDFEMIDMSKLFTSIPVK